MSEKTIKILMCIPLWGGVILWFYTFTKVIKGDVRNQTMLKLVPLVFLQIAPVMLIAVILADFLMSIGVDMILSIVILSIAVFYWSNYVVYKELKKNEII